MKYYNEYDTILGKLMIRQEADAVTGIYFTDREQIETGDEDVMKETSVILQAITEIQEYLAGKRTKFTFPYTIKGTEFQKRVWRALEAIPYGEVRSYKDIAAAVGCMKGYRAIGMANHSNPLPVVIPCHRVIGSDGKLAGYGGGLDKKELLLGIEGVHLKR